MRPHFKSCFLITVIFFLLTNIPSPVQAWGEKGHHVVARLAYLYLNPQAHSALENILKEETLEYASVWPDTVKKQDAYKNTASMHFVDIPKNPQSGQKQYEETRDCPNRSCVVTAINDFSVKLSNPQLSKKERLEALRFIIHFVGDIHQPLHCADDNDLGGNGKHVCYFDLCTLGRNKPKNLHGVWDSDIIEHTNLSEDAYVSKLANIIDNMPTDKRNQIENQPVEEWANESYKLAISNAYGLLPNQNGGVYRLYSEYSDANLRVVDQQLIKASIRLAKVLNEIFSSNSFVNSESINPIAGNRRSSFNTGRLRNSSSTNCGRN